MEFGLERPGSPSGAPADGPARGTTRARVHVGILVLAVFVAEWRLPAAIAVGGLYVLPVLLSPWTAPEGAWEAGRRAIRRVAMLCCIATLASSFSTLVDGDGQRGFVVALINRAPALFAIALTAYLVRMRQRVEARLRLARETTATTLESIADGVITTDGAGRVTFLNAAAERLTGWSAAEALGRRVEDVFPRQGVVEITSDTAAHWRPAVPSHADEAAAEPVGAAPAHEVEPEGAGSRELSIVRRDGERVPIEASSAPVAPQGGSSLSSADAAASDGETGGDGAPGRVLVFRDISERKRHQATVERLAFRDPLTGLANRTSFLDRLELELAHARRRDRTLGLLYLDLDRFKEVNDTLGHHAGDALLRSVAERLRDALREGDTVARIGGDEFLVILPDVGSAESALAVGAKLVERLSVPHDVEGRRLPAPPSVGLALFPADAEEAEELMRRADAGMYAAKADGGGRIARVPHPPLPAAAPGPSTAASRPVPAR